MTHATQPASHSAAAANRREPLNPAESLLVGTAAGVIEVAVDQPLVTLKNSLQTGGKTPLSGRALYAGFSANACGMALVTAVQTSVNATLKGWFSKGQPALSDEQKFLSATVAGATSALAACPSELIMLQHSEKVKAALQQKLPKPSYHATLADAVGQVGISGLYRGLAPTAGRDAGFTVAYAAGAPYLKERLKPYLGEWAATLVSGCSAGVIGALVTHPLDTLKTWRQSGSSAPLWKVNIKNTLEAAYKGFTPRATRVVMAVVLLSEATETLTEQLQTRKAK